MLVKLYAMAAESEEACEGAEPCGVTVGELVEAVQAGAGIGELFQEYGRPSILGVGHVRGNGKAVGQPEHAGPKDRESGSDDDVDDDADLFGGGGPPDHAGPKDHSGSPDHAGPKDKDGSEDRNGPPDHAGLKKKK